MDRIFISTDYHLWSNDHKLHHPYHSATEREKLARNILATGFTADDCWIYLGDLGDPAAMDVAWVKNLLGSIPARRILCRGNNDPESDDYYRDLGFDDVTDVVRVHNILFSHKPLKVAPDEINVHGHLHTEQLSSLGANHINAYATRWTDGPVLLEDLLDGANRQSLGLPDVELEHIKSTMEIMLAEDGDRYVQCLDLTDAYQLCPVDENVMNLNESTTDDGVFDEILGLNRKLNAMQYGLLKPGQKVIPPLELRNYDTTEEDYDTYWHLATPVQFMNQNGGVCWDYAAYEADYFKSQFPEIPFTTYYVEFDDHGDHPTHTFLLFQHGGHWYWFESSFKKVRGIYRGTSEAELIGRILGEMDRHYDGSPGKSGVLIKCPRVIFTYDATDKRTYGLGCQAFMDWVHKNGKPYRKIITAKSGDRVEKLTEAVLPPDEPIDEVLFPDVETAKYFETDDEKYRKTVAKAEQERDSVASLDEAAINDYEAIPYDAHHRQGKPYDLKSYREVFLDADSIEKYKSQCSMLDGMDPSDSPHGSLSLGWFDGRGVSEIPVAVIRLYDITKNGETYRNMTRLEVTPAYRGHGLAEQVLRRAMELGGTHLHVYRDNRVAKNLYTKLGFTEYGKSKDGKILAMRLDDSMDETVAGFAVLRYNIRRDLQRLVTPSAPLVESISFNDVKRIVDSLPKEEHKLLYHGSSFINSPNVIYRQIRKRDNPDSIGGFVEIYRFPDNADTGVLIIAVAPLDRGSGISDALLADAAEAARGKGLSRILVRIVKTNVPSIALFTRAGYRVVSTDDHYVKMEKSLTDLVETTNPHRWSPLTDHILGLMEDTSSTTYRSTVAVVNGEPVEDKESLTVKQGKRKPIRIVQNHLTEGASNDEDEDPEEEKPQYKDVGMGGKDIGHTNPLDDRSERSALAAKLGIRNVGDTHDANKESEEKAEAARLEKEIQDRHHTRMKNLRKANRVRRWNRFKRKVRSLLPGVKNEAVDDADAAWIEFSHDESDGHHGDQRRFFDHPDRYVDAADTIVEGTRILEVEDPTLRFRDPINEAAGKDQKLYPVYVVLIHSGTKLATAIRELTGATFTHASISFDPSLEHMYSFGAFEDKSRGRFGNGFKMENFKSNFFQSREIPYAIYVVPSTASELEMMQRRLDYFIRNDTKFRFNKLGLLKNFLGIFDNPQYRFFCSQFVADILRAGRPDSDFLANPGRVRPVDFTAFEDAIYVTGGESLKTYNPKITVTATNRILRTQRMKRKMFNEGAIYDLDRTNPWAADVLGYQLGHLSEDAAEEFLAYLEQPKLRRDADGKLICTTRELDELEDQYRHIRVELAEKAAATDWEGIKDTLCRLDLLARIASECCERSAAVDGSPRKSMLELRAAMLATLSSHVRQLKIIQPNYHHRIACDASRYGKYWDQNRLMLPAGDVTMIPT